MRRGEAIGLRWKDVDFDGQCLYVVQQITEVRGKSVVGTPKTKKRHSSRGPRRRHDRHAPPAPGGTGRRAHRLGGRMERRRPGLHPRGRQSAPPGVRDSALPARSPQQAGLPAIRLHDLRHTNASLALMAGVALKVVSERLGHSQISVTADLYTQVNQHVGRAAADQIAGLIRPPANAVPSASLAQEPETASRQRTDSRRNEQGPRPRFRRSGARSPVSTQSAPEGIRTPNLLIRSQMLYPLSYGRRSSP